MSIEETLALVVEQNSTILRELRDLRTQRQHDGGRWGSRAEAARHHGRSVDWIDVRLADGTLRGRKLGPEPKDRRDVRGRRIDRRRWEVWISGPPRTEAEIDALAEQARGAR